MGAQKSPSNGQGRAVFDGARQGRAVVRSQQAGDDQDHCTDSRRHQGPEESLESAAAAERIHAADVEEHDDEEEEHETGAGVDDDLDRG